MSAELTIIIAITGFISTASGLVLTFRNIKKTSPGEALKKWQKETEDKLDNDNRRIMRLEKMYEDDTELNRLLLKSIKGVLNHLLDGNHSNIMGDLIRDIDSYLINR